jgi:hypothetical protein
MIPPNGSQRFNSMRYKKAARALLWTLELGLAVVLFQLGDRLSVYHAKVVIERLARWSSAQIVSRDGSRERWRDPMRC